MQPSATLSLFRVNLVASDLPTSVQLAGFMFSCFLFAASFVCPASNAILEMIFLNSSLISAKLPTAKLSMFEMQP